MLGECFSKTRFLDAAGVLVGQSRGMMYAKSSKSGSASGCRAVSRPEPGTVRGDRKISGVREGSLSYVLTKVFRKTVVKLRYVLWTRVYAIAVGGATFPWSLRDTQRIFNSLLVDSDGLEQSRKQMW